MVAVGCEAGFQACPKGECTACHVARLLRDAEDSGYSRESLPTAVVQGAQCTDTILAAGVRCRRVPVLQMSHPILVITAGSRPSSHAKTHAPRELLPSHEGPSVPMPPSPSR